MKTKLKYYFLLSWSKILTIVITWIVAIGIHHSIYFFLYIDEPFFFIIAIFLIPIYLFICLLYSVYYYNKKDKVENEKINSS